MDGATADIGGLSISTHTNTANSSVTVDGIGSVFTINGEVNVGLNAPGSMTISNGGVVTQPNTSNLFIGRNDNGDNSAVTVTGTGTQLNVGQDLIISRFATGNTLTVEQGAAVNVARLTRIGEQVGRVGTADVDGVGTTLTTDQLSVGHGGPGFLNVSGGAQVTINETTILAEQLAGGVVSAASGTTVTVDGVGSRIDILNNGSVADSLIVGQVEDAQLLITGGGVVNNSGVILVAGDSGGRDSQIRVTGVGSRLNTDSSIVVGQGDRGYLDVQAGGVVTTNGNLLRTSVSSTLSGGSRVTVDGLGSSISAGATEIGLNQVGVFSVTSGGVYNGTSLFGGGNPNSAFVSPMTISEPGSLAHFTGNADIRNAQLVVDDSAVLNIDGTLTVLQTGPGTAGRSVAVLNGGELHVGGFVDIRALLTNGLGQLYVRDPGSKITIGGSAQIGRTGNLDGIFEVTNGATAIIGGSLFVEDGTMTLQDAGSSLSALSISRNSSEEIFNWQGGTLELTGGSLLIDETAFAPLNNGNGQGQTPDDPAVAGNQADRLILTDDPTTGRNLIVSGLTTIDGDKGLTLIGGTFRTGMLNLIDGTMSSAKPFNFASGTFELTNSGITIGNSGVLREPITTLSSSKTLIVSGQTLVEAGSKLQVNGGTFTSGGLSLLATGTFFGTIDSTIDSGPVTALGLSTIQIGSGNLTLGDSGALNGFYSNGQVIVAGGSTLNLADANDAVLDSGAFVTLGGFSAAGNLAAANGITLDFGGNITGFGTVNTPDDPFKPFTNNGNVTGNSALEPITLTGYVKGVGTLDNVVITGTDAPGFSPATVYRGSVTYAGSLEVEIGGTTPGDFDKIVHSGTATLGGILDVLLINGFTPSVGDSFDILDWSSLAGGFSTINLPTLAGNLEWDTSGLLVDGTLSVIAAALIPGDLDGNGFVGIADLNIVLGNWNQNVPAGNPIFGDPSGDGFVGIEDLNTVLGNWNAGTPPGGVAMTDIPEPSSLILLGLVSSIMLSMRHPKTRKPLTWGIPE